MKIVIPMAGMGKRMRPHTLTVPKPLLPIAGKTIVERLVGSIAEMTDEQIEEVAFVIGDFGKAVEDELIQIAKSIGAEGKIFHQEEPLGTAHAIYCAEPTLNGNVVVAFADTLFETDFKINPDDDGVIWVKQIEDPSQFGVVETNDEGVITRFIEKPKNFISDLAIIGIYYFKDGEFLRDEIKHLIDNKIIENGEYQITNAMEAMKEKGARLKVGQVRQWMDCGNKDATVDTNQRILELVSEKEDLIADNLEDLNSVIIPPCYIGNDVKIRNSVIGPHVSIGNGSEIENSNIENSIIMESSSIKNANVANSMIGNHVELHKNREDISIGDYTKIKE